LTSGQKLIDAPPASPAQSSSGQSPRVSLRPNQARHRPRVQRRRRRVPRGADTQSHHRRADPWRSGIVAGALARNASTSLSTPKPRTGRLDKTPKILRARVFRLWRPWFVTQTAARACARVVRRAVRGT
jgi:hypothetical protein